MFGTFVAEKREDKEVCFPLAPLAAPILGNFGGAILKRNYRRSKEEKIKTKILLETKLQGRVNLKRITLSDVEHFTLDMRESAEQIYQQL